ncbi:MAG: YbhN family protein [Ramlibacter sp.]
MNAATAMKPRHVPDIHPPLRPAPRVPTRLRDRAWWPWLTRGALVLFGAFVLGLLLWQAMRVDWPAVFAAMAATPVRVLLAAGAVALAGHLLYSTFDLLGRHYTGHHLAPQATMLVTFISYAFNLNFGAIVGSAAMRLRLYARLGLRTPVILRVMGLSMWTNWFGYLALAGAAFVTLSLPLPVDWHVSAAALRATGGVLLALALAWLVACATVRPGRIWRIGRQRQHEVWLPTPRLALLQLAVGAANWLLIAGVIWVLLQGRVAFPVVAGVFLVGVVVGIVTRVPAGLGVQEAVFVALLSPRVPEADMLAAMLTYRALYYWAPLLLAGLAYAGLEATVPPRGSGRHQPHQRDL